MDGSAIQGEFYDAALNGVTAAVGQMQLHVLLDLAEPFTREQVEAAVAGTVASFPVMGCRYEHGWWRDRWVPMTEVAATDVVEELGGDLDEVMEELPRRALEPAAGWPWRVAMIRRDPGQRLVLTVVHDLADGAGVLAVTREFVSQLTGGGSIAGEGAMDRGYGQLLRSLRLVDLPYLVIGGIAEAMTPLLVPLLGPIRLRTAEPAPAVPRPVFRTVSSGVGEGSPVRALCEEVGCTVNDVLLASLALLNASLSGSGRLGNFFTVNLRRHLADDAPRVSNLSGVDSVILPRDVAGSLPEAAVAVARRTQRMKRRLVGFAFSAMPALTLMICPHAVVRGVAAFWGRYTSLLLSRGLVVTNIGAMDRYVQALGENLVAASVLGPFGRGPLVPIITATGFRDRLTLQINAQSNLAEEDLERMANELSAILGGGEEG